jgi:hypothetical protein
MRATLDWSYGLLSPAEQHVFCHMAVFADTCSLEAVESVCGGSHPDDTVLETLDRLVDKSMLLAEEREGLVRYRMLEAIRQYAAEQLLASGSPTDARQRHLEYFVAYGEEREQDTNIGGKRRLAATAELVREYPDIRFALEWAIEAKEAQLGLRLARTVQYFWQARGYLTEGAACSNNFWRSQELTKRRRLTLSRCSRPGGLPHCRVGSMLRAPTTNAACRWRDERTTPGCAGSTHKTLDSTPSPAANPPAPESCSAKREASPKLPAIGSVRVLASERLRLRHGPTQSSTWRAVSPRRACVHTVKQATSGRRVRDW